MLDEITNCIGAFRESHTKVDELMVKQEEISKEMQRKYVDFVDMIAMSVNPLVDVCKKQPFNNNFEHLVFSFIRISVTKQIILICDDGLTIDLFEILTSRKYKSDSISLLLNHIDDWVKTTHLIKNIVNGVIVGGRVSKSTSVIVPLGDIVNASISAQLFYESMSIHEISLELKNRHREYRLEIREGIFDVMEFPLTKAIQESIEKLKCGKNVKFSLLIEENN